MLMCSFESSSSTGGGFTLVVSVGFSSSRALSVSSSATMRARESYENTVRVCVPMFSQPYRKHIKLMRVCVCLGGGRGLLVRACRDPLHQVLHLLVLST